jgi:DNA invertase Pin-like site-specific DNA recombinase
LVLVWRLDQRAGRCRDLVSTLEELNHLEVGFVSLDRWTEALDLTAYSSDADR